MTTLNTVSSIDNGLASALTSLGRCISSTGSATASIVKAMVRAQRHPAFLLSPNDTQGKPNKNTASTASQAEWSEITLLVAKGMANPKNLGPVKTCEALFLFDHASATARITALSGFIKAAKKTEAKNKAAWQVERDLLTATKKARNVMLTVISSKLRDIKGAVITAYANQEKAKLAKAGASDISIKVQTLKTKLIEECKPLDKRGATKPADKTKANALTQHAKNLLASLQKSEELPLKAKQNNALIALLTELIEVSIKY